jgi:hypothetical protein
VLTFGDTLIIFGLNVGQKLFMCVNRERNNENDILLVTL